MCLVRSALQLILASCLVALPACADIWNSSGFGPFKYQIIDDKGKFRCLASYMDNNTVLAAADCFEGFDYTNAVVHATNTGEAGNVTRQIGLIQQIKNSTFAVARVTRSFGNVYIETTPLCANGQLCNKVLSCSNCTDIDYSNSFIDYDAMWDWISDSVNYAAENFLELQSRQTNTSVYYHKGLDIEYANYLIQLKDGNGTFLCAGALLSSDFVVTAAECFHGIDYTNVVVVAGTQTLAGDDDSITRHIQKVIIHPTYNVKTKHSNVAVLKLLEPYDLGFLGVHKIGRISLCKKSLKENDFVKVSGWRHMSKYPATDLHNTVIPLMSKDKCYQTFNGTHKRRTFCTVGNGLDDQYSVSDLGGPAVFNEELYGIATSCSKCDGVDYSNTFVDLYYLRQFILTAMRPENCSAWQSPVQNRVDKPQAIKPPANETDIYSPTKIKDVPYLVQLRDDNGKFLCAGTLISNDSVLTAAVCLHNIHYPKVVVVARAETLTEVGVQRQIKKVVIVNRYGIETDCQNIALLKLKEPLLSDEPGNDNIAILPYFGTQGIERVRVMGWRHMYTNNTEENKLTSTFIRKTWEGECPKDLPPKYNGILFCFAGNKYENQFCVSDVGGPVLCGDKLCGIVTSCSKCGDIDYAIRVIDIALFQNDLRQVLAGKIKDHI